MWGITRRDGNCQDTGIAMKQESPVARTEELPEKRSAREKAKRRGNAKEERVHFGLIDGASDSVGNHVGMRINKARGEPGFSWLFRRSHTHISVTVAKVFIIIIYYYGHLLQPGD